ncbi:hypothetical protein MRX96_023344 [Rhipicephalus microplus]
MRETKTYPFRPRCLGLTEEVVFICQSLVDILDRRRYVELYEEHMQSIVERRKWYEKGALADQLEDMWRDILREQCEQPPCCESTSEPVVAGVNCETDLTCAELPLAVVNDFSDVATMTLPPGQCAAVKVREDVMSAADYNAMMRLKNVEQPEIVIESYHNLMLRNRNTMRVFMTGPAGCGKPFTTLALMKTFNRIYATPESKNNAYVATATTVKAAAANGGVTMHTALKNNMNGDEGLRHSDLNTFTLAFAHVRLLVID